MPRRSQNHQPLSPVAVDGRSEDSDGTALGSTSRAQQGAALWLLRQESSVKAAGLEGVTSSSLIADSFSGYHGFGLYATAAA